MYDAKLSKKETYFESKTLYSRGKKIKAVKLPWGKIGLTICYDLRFPNLYRKWSKKGCFIISLFHLLLQKLLEKNIGTALLKARAIENFCYIFAPAQGWKTL